VKPQEIMAASRSLRIRNPSQVPFYCHPVKLFVAGWLMMLGSLELHISYTTYPDLSLPLNLFACSLLPLLVGYFTVHLAHKAINYRPDDRTVYCVDATRLRRFHLLISAIALGIVLLNLGLYGAPPIAGFFGAETLDYQEYGSLRQVLFPLVMILFVSAPLEHSHIRRWILYVSSVGCMVAYVTRGYLLIMLFQVLILFSLRTAMSKKKLYVIAVLALCSAVIISDLIGNGRNSLGSAALLGSMQIKRSYYDWPTSYLWIVSYVSTPISNMCWIIRSYQYDHPSGAFLYSMLPSFWAPPLNIEVIGDHIVDGVHSYLAKYYFDFWYLGICGVNYLWGCLSGYLTVGNRLTRNFFASTVLLSCIGFMFFSDFLTILIIPIELIGLSVAHRYVTYGWSREAVVVPRQ
jgi:hypothetical protein